MSAADRAAELRAQADALESMAELEQRLLAAKAAHAESSTAETRAAKREAALALRDARALVRAGRTQPIGGDAFVSSGSES